MHELIYTKCIEQGLLPGVALNIFAIITAALPYRPLRRGQARPGLWLGSLTRPVVKRKEFSHSLTLTAFLKLLCLFYRLHLLTAFLSPFISCLQTPAHPSETSSSLHPLIQSFLPCAPPHPPHPRRGLQRSVLPASKYPKYPLKTPPNSLRIVSNCLSLYLPPTTGLRPQDRFSS